MASTLQYIGGTTEIAGAAFNAPAHQPGDLILYTGRGGVATDPILPPGFAHIISATGYTAGKLVIGWKFATGTSLVIPASGAETQHRAVSIFRGAQPLGPIGAVVQQSDAVGDSNLAFPACNFTASTSTSWAFAAATFASSQAADNDGRAPANLIVRNSIIEGTAKTFTYDTGVGMLDYPASVGPNFAFLTHQTSIVVIEILQDDTIIADLLGNLDNASFSSTASVLIDASLVRNLDDATLQSEAFNPIGADLIATLDDSILASETSLVGPITANLTSQLQDATLVSLATSPRIASLNQVLDDAILSASIASLDVSVWLDQTLDDAVLASTAYLDIRASLSSTLNDATLRSTAHTETEHAQVADECCSPRLCDLDPCVLICNFVTLLPSGPLWDEAKTKVFEAYFNQPKPECVDDLWQVPCIYDDTTCAHLVRHSVYTARRLYDALMNALWPALRESDPLTAYDTIDDWLDRLGWISCFETTCRDINVTELSPLDVGTICGGQYCEPEYPECLQVTVKHKILEALERLKFGLIKNVTNINKIIEPLGARIRVDMSRQDECPNVYIIEPTTEEFDTWHRLNCLPQSGKCKAYYEPNLCYQTGLPQRIYPGVLAAECIVRSLLLSCGLITFKRSCEVPTEDSGLVSLEPDGCGILDVPSNCGPVAIGRPITACT